MKRLLEVLLVLIFAISVQAVCPTQQIVSAGSTLTAPDTFTELALVKNADGSIVRDLPLTASQAVPPKQQHLLSVDDIAAMKKARNDLGGLNISLRWSDGSTHCDVPITFADEVIASPPPKDAGSALGGTSDDFAACKTGGRDWEKKLRTTQRDGHFAVVILSDDNNVCFRSADIGRIAVGDPVYIGVFTSDQFRWSSPQFDPCNLKSSEPAFNAPSTGTTAFALASGREGGGRVLLPIDGPPDPQRCYDPAVTITVEGRKVADGSAAPSLTYTLRQYPRYNFTLQLGVERTDLQEHTFDLRTEGSKSFIIDKGPAKTGPEYFAAVVVYAIPRYFQSLGKNHEFYPGRDVVHDKGAADRLSLLLGTALQKPTRRFTIGLGFEVADGINITYGYNYARLPELVGHKNGDEFTGTAATIPTQDVWQRGWAAGISLDMRYALALLQR
jgi:hypothetical protein